MESLLSLSFENISSKEPSKIRKGLRQIEGLLAQICLSQPSTQIPSSPSKRRLSALKTPPTTASPKSLRDLNSDPAFREFWRLQEGFEWNVPTRLLPTLTTLLSLPSSPPLGHPPSTTNPLILSALDLLHALLLLHPPSRALFATPHAMALLLDLLDPSDSNAPPVQCAALLALVAALLGCPRNTRVFERVGGLAMVTSLLRPGRASGRGKGSKTSAGKAGGGEAVEVSTEVRVKVLEFLYFYLMPETASDKDEFWRGDDDHDDDGDGQRGRGSGKSAASAASSSSSGSGSGSDGARDTKTSREKQRLLGRYLSNVEDLVQDLRESAPFGEVAAC